MAAVIQFEEVRFLSFFNIPFQVLSCDLLGFDLSRYYFKVNINSNGRI